MNETATLVCPKCGSDMRTYERNGVTVDQCTGCRGIFLDRGELERLVDAEGQHYSAERDDQPREQQHQQKRKSKKRSFLENLFEGE